MVSEPPGEPYYIARVMEFVYRPEEKSGGSSSARKSTASAAPANGNSSPTNDALSADSSVAPPSKRKRRSTVKALQLLEQPTRKTRSKDKMGKQNSIPESSSSPSKVSAISPEKSVENYMVRVNWFYRPKDISKKSSDSRQLFATMNSDLCPLASIRGKCVVKHRDHVSDLEEFRMAPDTFWFEKLFDRYIIRFFDVVPTEKIINIPEKAQKVLCERFKFAIVEVGRGKELCSSPKNCEKCTQWCSPDDSVQCAHCKHYYHMLCVDPPLEKKPSRGFGWSCAICAGAKERKIQEQRGLLSLKASAIAAAAAAAAAATTSPTAPEAATPSAAASTENTNEIANNGASFTGVGDTVSVAPSTATVSDDGMPRAEQQSAANGENNNQSPCIQHNTDADNVVTSNENSVAPTSNQPAQSPPASATPSSGNTQNDPSTSPPPMTRFEQLAEAFKDDVNTKEITDEQRRQLKLWPFRYLGVHAKIEDVLDMDDRIYPRAASRLGQKHQASVSAWPGRPVIYYDFARQPERKSRGKSKAGRKSQASTKYFIPNLAAVDPSVSADSIDGLIKSKSRPPWYRLKPAGYIERGGDDTSTLLWKRPDGETSEEEALKNDGIVEQYLQEAGEIATRIGVPAYTPNFVDSCLKAYMDTDRNTEAALQIASTFTKESLKEPILTEDEKVRFAEGVRLYGSELHDVTRHVGTKPSADIVRYYYLWKKTPEGHKIWDNYEGRRRNRLKELARHDGGGPLVDDVADSADDSAYDSDKATLLQRTYVCKHCKTTHSRAWRRAPGHPVASNSNPITALCIRCARLWRRYGVVWEEPEDVMRRAGQRGGTAWKRKIEQELIDDARAILAEREQAGSANGSVTRNKRQRHSSSSLVSLASAEVQFGVSDTQSTLSAVDEPTVSMEFKAAPITKPRGVGRPPKAGRVSKVAGRRTGKKPGPKPRGKPGRKPKAKIEISHPSSDDDFESSSLSSPSASASSSSSPEPLASELPTKTNSPDLSTATEETKVSFGPDRARRPSERLKSKHTVNGAVSKLEQESEIAAAAGISSVKIEPGLNKPVSPQARPTENGNDGDTAGHRGPSSDLRKPMPQIANVEADVMLDLPKKSDKSALQHSNPALVAAPVATRVLPPLPPPKQKQKSAFLPPLPPLPTTTHLHQQHKQHQETLTGSLLPLRHIYPPKHQMPSYCSPDTPNNSFSATRTPQAPVEGSGSSPVVGAGTSTTTATAAAPAHSEPSSSSLSHSRTGSNPSFNSSIQFINSSGSPASHIAPTAGIADVKVKLMKRQCSVCHVPSVDENNELLEQQAVCSNCGLNVHLRCYGLPSDFDFSANWLCASCDNDLDPHLSTFYSCILCPIRETCPDMTNRVIDTCPDALKPTFDSNWAHVKCTIWIPELFFGSRELQPIDGIHKLGDRFTKVCQLCESQCGACINCPHCGMSFHVGCADKQQYFRGIEVTPATQVNTYSDYSKSARNGTTELPFVKFNGKLVSMVPVILCCNAPRGPQHLSLGEVDSETGETVLEIYIQNYKIRQLTKTGAMKRALIYANDEKSKSSQSETQSNEEEMLDSLRDSGPRCHECGTDDSLIWWDKSEIINGKAPSSKTPSSSASSPSPLASPFEQQGQKLCQKCYWRFKDPQRYSEAYEQKPTVYRLTRELPPMSLLNASVDAMKNLVKQSNISSQVIAKIPISSLTNNDKDLEQPQGEDRPAINRHHRQYSQQQQQLLQAQAQQQQQQPQSRPQSQSQPPPPPHQSQPPQHMYQHHPPPVQHSPRHRHSSHHPRHPQHHHSHHHSSSPPLSKQFPPPKMPAHPAHKPIAKDAPDYHRRGSNENGRPNQYSFVKDSVTGLKQSPKLPNRYEDIQGANSGSSKDIRHEQGLDPGRRDDLRGGSSPYFYEANNRRPPLEADGYPLPPIYPSMGYSQQQGPGSYYPHHANGPPPMGSDYPPYRQPYHYPPNTWRYPPYMPPQHGPPSEGGRYPYPPGPPEGGDKHPYPQHHGVQPPSQWPPAPLHDPYAHHGPPGPPGPGYSSYEHSQYPPMQSHQYPPPPSSYSQQKGPSQHTGGSGSYRYDDSAPSQHPHPSKSLFPPSSASSSSSSSPPLSSASTHRITLPPPSSQQSQQRPRLPPIPQAPSHHQPYSSSYSQQSAYYPVHEHKGAPPFTGNTGGHYSKGSYDKMMKPPLGRAGNSGADRSSGGERKEQKE